MKILKGLSLIALLSFVACKSGEENVKSIRKVKCERAYISSENHERALFPGKVVAATDANLGFRVAGIIDEASLENGAYVAQGQVLARLDSRDYALQLAATQAEYDAVSSEVERVVALYNDESVSANDYDKAVNGLKAITAKLEAHKNALADTELRAPFSGYVTSSNFSKGEAVAAGTPVVSIISASSPEITVDIPASYYLKQDSFDSAVATIELLNGSVFNLKLKGVSPKGNLNQLYKATFVVEACDGVLPSVGMSAMVEVKYAAVSDISSLVIPFSAIVNYQDECSIWVLSDGKAERRIVSLGEIANDGKALVTGDIKVGELVIIAGVNTITEGQTLSLLEPVSSSNIGGLK